MKVMAPFVVYIRFWCSGCGSLKGAKARSQWPRQDGKTGVKLKAIVVYDYGRTFVTPPILLARLGDTEDALRAPMPDPE